MERDGDFSICRLIDLSLSTVKCGDFCKPNLGSTSLTNDIAELLEGKSAPGPETRTGNRLS